MFYNPLLDDLLNLHTLMKCIFLPFDDSFGDAKACSENKFPILINVHRGFCSEVIGVRVKLCYNLNLNVYKLKINVTLTPIT